ncbi:MAG TPA: serine/threonine-protein kinase [Kofleriaceae bacterium]|jgi:serine/threonine-protein kinase|nr:serine/threonine-protein kinase [Kofleriaceae bacterium]
MSDALPYRLLRAHLDASAPDREKFIAKLFIGCTLFALACVIGFATPEKRAIIAPNTPVFAIPLAYHIGLLVALRRDRFHWILPWIGTFVLASALAPPFYFAVQQEGAAFAVGGVIQSSWMALVAVSALRANPMLSIGAGVIGGIEYLAISLAQPMTGEQRSEVLTLAAMFIVDGVIAAGIASYLLRQAQQALRAVRSQDLMGKYFMHERLGAGGMAEVFRATYSPEGGFEKIVAVKRVLPDVAEAADGRLFVDMFREEARLCAQLSHPNVVQVLDAGQFGGRYVLAMELVDGVSLHRVIHRAGRPMPIAAVAFAGAELAAALDYIHARVDSDGISLGLVHRDVNPPNVLVSRLGEVKLADFGVAHAVNRATLDPERVYGKLGYLAPEQLHAQKIDGRADLFALGLTVYEMVTGKPMLRGVALDEVDDIRNPEVELGDDVPLELRRLIGDLLAVAPDNRPANGAVVRARLLALTGDAAPFPSGQVELAKLVKAALEARPLPARPSTVATDLRSTKV